MGQTGVARLHQTLRGNFPELQRINSSCKLDVSVKINLRALVVVMDNTTALSIDVILLKPN